MFEEIGFPTRKMAGRLRCSERQILRIVKANRFRRRSPISELIGSEDEKHLWIVYYRAHKSFSAVAMRFGVTRQAVEQFIKQTGVVNG